MTVSSNTIQFSSCESSEVLDNSQEGSWNENTIKFSSTKSREVFDNSQESPKIEGWSNENTIEFSSTESTEVTDNTEEPSMKESTSNIDTFQLPSSQPDNSQNPIGGHSIQMPVFDLRAYIESAGHQVASCPHLFIDSFSCKGHLHKLGAIFHGWSKRWFVFDMKRSALMYFSDSTEKKIKGGSYFQTIESVFLDPEIAPKNGKPGCVFVVKTNERSYTLHAASDAAAMIWINVIISRNLG